MSRLSLGTQRAPCERPVSLFGELLFERRMRLAILHERTQRRADSFRECDCERRIRHRVRAAIQEEANELGVPGGQYVGERNRTDLGAVLDQHFYKVQPFLLDRDLKCSVLERYVSDVPGE